MAESTRTPDPTLGLWGTVARKEGLVALARALVKELEEGLELLRSLAPAVTFFGGARVRPQDPYHAAAAHMGELLAERGIPPRTGAGPGIMSAVPEGYRRRLAELGAAVPEPRDGSDVAHAVPGQGLTQGFNIKLPFEQAVNPAIDVSLELVHFPTRKLMLYENALGLVIFPGGFGTLDELLEVWRLKMAGRLTDPFVLFGRDFWGPLADTLRSLASSARRACIPSEAFGLLHLTDEPEEAIERVSAGSGRAGFDEPPEALGKRIATELMEGLTYLESLPPAVTVLGGSRLAEDDPTMRAAEELARRLALEGVATRAAGPGPLSVTLARGGHAGARYLPQQAFGMHREDARNLYGADRVHLVNDRLTHKVLLTEGSRAVVALPGGVGTLDELFSVLCQLQTGTIAHRPVVLVGADYWEPIWSVLRAQMLDGPRQTIAPEDLELVVITDDPTEAARRCLSGAGTAHPRASRR